MKKLQQLFGQKLPALHIKLWSDDAVERRDADHGSVAILQHGLSTRHDR